MIYVTCWWEFRLYIVRPLRVGGFKLCKKFILTISSILISAFLLSGCSHDDRSKPPTSNQPNPQESTQNEVQTQPDGNQQVYIDEAGHEGEELELIKIVNLSTKYRNEGNEEEYIKLFAPNNMTTLTAQKIESLQLESISFMSENVGTVRTKVKYDHGNEAEIALYIFEKDDNQWIMSGTD